MTNRIEFIAEIGLNHNGNFGLIPELIAQAAASGADYAKFQIGWRDKANEINALGATEIEMIIRYCSYFDIRPLFSVFHSSALSLLLSSSYERSAIKIASRTLADNTGLVREVSSLYDRVFVSTGMVDRSSIPDLNISNLHYLWCVSDYPLHPFDIKDFPSVFTPDQFCGISDHTQGQGLSLIAAVRGAQVIERHFTLDKSDVTIRDHALSSTPSEFKQLVSSCREIARLLPYVQ